MDTLDALQQLFVEAKKEPAVAIDVVESVCHQIRSDTEQPEPSPTLNVWGIAAGASALAAVIPLALVVKVFLALDDAVMLFFPLTQGAWLW